MSLSPCSVITDHRSLLPHSFLTLFRVQATNRVTRHLLPCRSFKRQREYEEAQRQKAKRKEARKMKKALKKLKKMYIEKAWDEAAEEQAAIEAEKEAAKKRKASN